MYKFLLRLKGKAKEYLGQLLKERYFNTRSEIARLAYKIERKTLIFK